MKILFLSLLTTSLVFASGSMKGHQHEKMNHPDENVNFNNALKKYELVAQAFFDQKNEQVKKNVKSLLEAIDKIQDEKVSKTLKYSKAKLNEILKSDDNEKNKEAFSTISQAFNVVLTKFAGNKNYMRYYCPMVKKYWIQNVKKTGDKTYNIYASSSMPNCGGAK
jgi:hypothetical protein